MCFIWDAGVPRSAPDGFDPHLAPQPLDLLPVDSLPVLPLKQGHEAAAPEAGVFHVEFIKVSHNLFLFGCGTFFPVVHHAATDAQKLALSALTHLGMLFFNQLGAP